MNDKTDKTDKAESPGMLKAMASALISRMSLSSYLGQQFGGKRDLYEVFGYPKVLRVQQLLAKYERQDIASRIVSMPAGATWNNHPTVTGNNEFNGAWNNIVRKHHLWNVLLRADKLSAMGRYSTVLIGVDDSRKLDVPLTSSPNKVRNITYLKPLSEASVTIDKFETDETNPRFGMPKIYKVSLANDFNQTLAGEGSPSQVRDVRVHYSRILHIAQDPLEDTIFGTPVLQRIYNLLEDLLKVAGGTAEAFWLNGRRGMQADIDKDMELDSDDASDLSDMIEEYQHELRRIIRTRGVTLKDLGTNVSDPRGTFDVVTALIAGATGIPQRILVGSEAGQLASEQDRANWADRIEERRTEFAEPMVLEPFIERCMEYGILPRDDNYQIVWPEAFKMSPLERAQTMAQKARAVTNLVKQYDGKTVPITSVEESRSIIGYDTPFDPSSVPSVGGGNDDSQSSDTEDVDPAEEQQTAEEDASDEGVAQTS